MTKKTTSGAADGRRARNRTPVPPRWSKARTDRFLEVLAATTNVSEAARAAGMTASSAYERKRRDARFAAAWAEALEIGFAELEMLLLRHALQGSERTETVTDSDSGKVKQIKTVHSYPVAVAMRLLIAHREEVERYRSARGVDPVAASDAAERVRAELKRIRERLGLAKEAAQKPETPDGPA